MVLIYDLNCKDEIGVFVSVVDSFCILSCDFFEVKKVVEYMIKVKLEFFVNMSYEIRIFMNGILGMVW